MALVLPVLIVLLSVILEGGLAINAWLRVNTAARDGTRFAMDGATNAEIGQLILEKLSELDQSRMDIYLVKSRTNSGGVIIPSEWDNDNVYHLHGSGAAEPNVSRVTIQQRLGTGGTAASRNISVTIVEVDYRYLPQFMRLVTGALEIPMSSYAIVQQY